MLFFPGPNLNSWKCEGKASLQMLANFGNAGSAVLEFSLQLVLGSTTGTCCVFAGF